MTSSNLNVCRKFTKRLPGDFIDIILRQPLKYNVAALPSLIQPPYNDHDHHHQQTISNTNLKIISNTNQHPTTLFRTPPSQPQSATTTREFYTPRLNYVLAKGFSTVSSLDKVTLATVEWEEMEVVADVKDFIDGEFVKASMSVRAYFFDTSYMHYLFWDNIFKLEVGKVLFICQWLYFSQGLDASRSGSDNSYMVVFNYGSVVLLNVDEREVHERLEIVEAHASGSTGEIRKFYGTTSSPATRGYLLPQNTLLRLSVSWSDHCWMVHDIGFSEVLACIFQI
ncbi:hypothetical protein CTI12_AA149310 [Artemisia annua]|uniref:Uncharacterized protein n=1 Tax=Artemisia annua TaxID=35608 RepID=A0A2U1NEV9_ARTAN|nr:hypothetical protein CTI12_AA149310 [Artemisia annua]